MNRQSVALILWATLGVTPAAVAQEDSSNDSDDRPRAEQAAVEAFAAYLEGDVDESLRLYEESLSASASSNVLFELARLYDRHGKAREAREVYQRFLRTPDAEPHRAELARVRVRALAAQGAVTERRGQPKIAAAPVPPPHTQRAPTPPRMVPLAPPPSRTLRILGAISLGTGLASIGTGIGLSVLARKYGDVSDATCNGNACWSQQGVVAARLGNRAAATATAMLVTGGAFTAAGLTLVILQRPNGREGGATMQISPLATERVVGATMSGAW